MHGVFCRARRSLESRMDSDEDRSTAMEQKLRETQTLLREVEQKSDEVSNFIYILTYLDVAPLPL